jgi:hypothetical protein
MLVEEMNVIQSLDRFLGKSSVANPQKVEKLTKDELAMLVVLSV